VLGHIRAGRWPSPSPPSVGPANRQGGRGIPRRLPACERGRPAPWPGRLRKSRRQGAGAGTGSGDRGSGSTTGGAVTARQAFGFGLSPVPLHLPQGNQTLWAEIQSCFLPWQTWHGGSTRGAGGGATAVGAVVGVVTAGVGLGDAGSDTIADPAANGWATGRATFPFTVSSRRPPPAAGPIDRLRGAPF